MSWDDGYAQLEWNVALSPLFFNSIAIGWSLSFSEKSAAASIVVLVLCIVSIATLGCAALKYKRLCPTGMLVDELRKVLVDELRKTPDSSEPRVFDSSKIIDKKICDLETSLDAQQGPIWILITSSITLSLSALFSCVVLSFAQ